MRFPAVLFAFYLLVLSCLPCADDAVRMPANNQVAVAAQGHGCGNEHKLADGCTPLCQCQCSPSIVMLLERPAVFAFAPAPIGWGSLTYGLAGSNDLPVRPLATPWQPPQRA